jgi:hypothetical protein
MHSLRDTGCLVKGNRQLHCVGILLEDCVLTKKLTSSVGSVYLKTLDWLNSSELLCVRTDS